MLPLAGVSAVLRNSKDNVSEILLDSSFYNSTHRANKLIHYLFRLAENLSRLSYFIRKQLLPLNPSIPGLLKISTNLRFWS